MANDSISVIVIAQNEEPNIRRAVRSCVEWARAVFVVDANSTDRTGAIAEQAGARVFQHSYNHAADQRNWAVTNLPVTTKWALFLDADEYLTAAFREDVDTLLPTLGDDVVAVQVRFEFYFLGRRLRWAYRHPPRARLVRPGRVRWEWAGAYEYIVHDGPSPCLATPIVHDDRKNLRDFLSRQMVYAERDARALLGQCVAAADRSTQSRENKNRLAKRLWARCPLFVRPFLYFLYRYVLQGGFLDGRAGFLYLFFQSLWLRMLVDARYLELRQRAAEEKATLPRADPVLPPEDRNGD